MHAFEQDGLRFAPFGGIADEVDELRLHGVAILFA
jgi:hypothetical protein